MTEVTKPGAALTRAAPTSTTARDAALLSQEAKAGDSEAEVNLGYLFAEGQGVIADQ